MATLFCKWPPNDQTSAQAYLDECDAQLAIAIGEPGAKWANAPREDQNGNWTVALLGPPWKWQLGTPFAEPASCAALREDAVVVETPEWPVEEE